MDIKQLQYFVVSVDMGSFCSAAEVLITTQPNVSKVVKSLETELNMILLNRDRSGVTLTKEFDERFPNGGLKGWGQVRNCGNDYTAIRMNTIVRAWDSSVTIVVQQVAGTIIEDNTDCEIEWYALGK